LSQQNETITQKTKIMTIITALQLNEMTNKAVEYAHTKENAAAYTLVEFAKKDYLVKMSAELVGRKEYKVVILVEDTVALEMNECFIGNSYGGHAFLIEQIEKELKRQNKQ